MPELRKDPVTEGWVIVSTERRKRPTDFPSLPEEEDHAGCPFCPGNEDKTPPEIIAFGRDGGKPNTPGWKVRVVPNKFPALGIEGELDRRGLGMYDLMNGIGAHEVIIETPDHNRHLKDSTVEEIQLVLRAYQQRMEDLLRDPRLRYTLIFKNQGGQAGASLHHPHSQLIATPVTPKKVREELIGSQRYWELKERCVFCDIIRQEQDTGDRIVYENEAFVAFCPFASRFPFEVWILPKKHSPDFHTITPGHIPFLADMLRIVLGKLASALGNPQYNYILHTGPARFARRGYWETIEQDYHWHLEIIPRLTKIAGFEWGTSFYINPTPPEEAASYLREREV
jgi:UDPglucose--hexose-1-phosphate uridylyltransferase